ncbi:MAG: alkaline shock response membrane anchor protein AmaP [Chloroflexota bacterium]|nr:alkaline shock response membrane anchor protein AmaP [Chloroflexota bacterium]
MTDDEGSTTEGAMQSRSERADASRIDEAKPQPSSPSGLTIVLWALVSIGLLAFVALGSIPAYIWRSGRKYQEFKSILGTWTIEANNLPRVSQQWLMDGVFYAALIAFLLGAIAGLWFLLRARDEEASSANTPSAQNSGPTTA